MRDSQAVAAILVLFMPSTLVLAQDTGERGIQSPHPILDRRETLMRSLGEGIAVLYSQSGPCEMGVQQESGWTSRWSSTADMPVAGVYLFNDRDDVFYACRSPVCLHARDDGERRLHFPVKAQLRDTLTGETPGAGILQSRFLCSRCFASEGRPARRSATIGACVEMAGGSWSCQIEFVPLLCYYGSQPLKAVSFVPTRATSKKGKMP